MIELVKFMRGITRIAFLIVIDLLAFYLSLLAAWTARSEILPSFMSDLPAFPFSLSYFVSLWWIPVIFIFFMLYEGLYEKNLPFWDETRLTVKALFLAAVTIMTVVTLGKMQDMISRIVLLGMSASALLAFPVLRLWGKKILYNLGIWRERALVLGAGNAGRLATEGLMRERHTGYDIIGFLDDDEGKWGEVICGKKVFGRVRHFPKFVKDLGIETIIIAMPSLSPDRLAALTSSVQNHSINTMVIPDLKGIALLNTNLQHLFYEELFLMNIRNNLKSLPNRTVKKLFDLIVGLTAMPLLLIVIGVIGVAIMLETPGFAIYAHDRVGRNGRVFRCYKFRTMRCGADESLEEMLENDTEMRLQWEKNRKLKNDPRITKLGRFLRKTSLDELPQIFNVIKGEMSLVGPRPVTKEEIEKHYQEAAGLCFSVRPGITGLWQVSGRSIQSYDYRIRLDSWYVMNWSLWFDIAIIFKTIRVVAKMQGAY